MEQWKDVVEFPDYYQISNQGRVRNKRTLHIMAQKCHFKGHWGLTLYIAGRRYYRFPHRMMLEAFIGPCPVGYESCHNDGNPSNNRLDNLRWDTRVNNWKDKIKHGRAPIGEKAYNAKLTKSCVIAIRALDIEGVPHAQLSKIFGVTRATIWDVVKRKSWKHV